MLIPRRGRTHCEAMYKCALHSHFGILAHRNNCDIILGSAVQRNEKMSQDQIEKLEQKQAQIKAQIQLIRNREATKQRKIDTRKKILAGSAVLDAARKDPAAQEKLTKLLDSFLTAGRDRKLFDLPIKEKPATEIEISENHHEAVQVSNDINQPEPKRDLLQSMRDKFS